MFLGKWRKKAEYANSVNVFPSFIAVRKLMQILTLKRLESNNYEALHLVKLRMGRGNGEMKKTKRRKGQRRAEKNVEEWMRNEDKEVRED